MEFEKFLGNPETAKFQKLAEGLENFREFFKFEIIVVYEIVKKMVVFSSLYGS